MTIVIDTEIIDCLENNGSIYSASLVLKYLTCIKVWYESV